MIRALLAAVALLLLAGAWCQQRPQPPTEPVPTGGGPGVDAGTGGSAAASAGGSAAASAGGQAGQFATCQFVEVLAARSAERQAEPRIINGKPADPKKYSGVCSLQSPSGSHYCSAELLSDDKVLSAGHCWPSFGDRVVCGCGEGEKVVDLRSPKCQVRHVSIAYQHILYVDWRKGHDWSMVKVDTAFEGLKPIPLSEDLRPGEAVSVAGFGRTCSTCATSKVLLEAELTLMTQSSCEKAYPGAITDSMVCAIGLGKDAAPGDSGGFLGQLINGKEHQIAGVSWGAQCLAADPGHDPDQTCIGVYASLRGEVAGIKACIKKE